MIGTSVPQFDLELYLYACSVDITCILHRWLRCPDNFEFVFPTMCSTSETLKFLTMKETNISVLLNEHNSSILICVSF